MVQYELASCLHLAALEAIRVIRKSSTELRWEEAYDGELPRGGAETL